MSNQNKISNFFDKIIRKVTKKGKEVGNLFLRIVTTLFETDNFDLKMVQST